MKEPRREAGVLHSLNSHNLRGAYFGCPVIGSTCCIAFAGAVWYWTALEACCTGASIAPVCCGATTGGLIAASFVQRSLNSTRPSVVYSLLKQVQGPATRAVYTGRTPYQTGR